MRYWWSWRRRFAGGARRTHTPTSSSGAGDGPGLVPQQRSGEDRHFEGFEGSRRWRSGRTAHTRRAPQDEIERAEQLIGAQFPRDLADFMGQADAAEGFVGDAYLAMWPVASLADLNLKARVPEFAPDLVFVATDGGGGGFAFHRATLAFVNAPMIGMRIVEHAPVGQTFGDFLRRMATDNPVRGATPVVDQSRLGLVVHEVTPIIVGGSPTDPANKALVPLDKYAEIVGWWNERLPSRDMFAMPGPGMPSRPADE
jgi:hypothetical protein